MPVTIKTSEYDAETTTFNLQQTLIPTDTSLLKEILSTTGKCLREPSKLVQSSIDDDTTQAQHSRLTACSNGFLAAVFLARAKFQHLTIRPDDIWLAILFQFNIYINTYQDDVDDRLNYERLDELPISNEHVSRWTDDQSMLVDAVSALLVDTIPDVSLRDWVEPRFSTTTLTDKLIAHIVMLVKPHGLASASEPTPSLSSTHRTTSPYGIPSVTLLGDRADYADILNRLSIFPFSFSDPSSSPSSPLSSKELYQFISFLRPVLSRIITSFDRPDGDDTLSFWKRMYSSRPGSPGVMLMRGWITAFTHWADDGTLLCPLVYQMPPSARGRGSNGLLLVLDGMVFPPVRQRLVVRGWEVCRVGLDGAHEGEQRVEESARAWMVVGSVGMEYTESKEDMNRRYSRDRDGGGIESESGSSSETLWEEGNDTSNGMRFGSVRPVTGWIVFKGGLETHVEA